MSRKNEGSKHLTIAASIVNKIMLAAAKNAIAVDCLGEVSVKLTSDECEMIVALASDEASLEIDLLKSLDLDTKGFEL
jgi:hypothetical protein